MIRLPIFVPTSTSIAVLLFVIVIVLVDVNSFHLGSTSSSSYYSNNYINTMQTSTTTTTTTTTTNRHSFVISPIVTKQSTTKLFSSSTSSSTTIPSSTNNNKRKRTVLDRTSVDAIALINDIIKIISETGLQAGPQRTIQALRVLSQVNQQYLPELLQLSSRTSNSNKELSLLVPKIIRTIFEKLGATYVKLGQFIASSPTLFPPEYVLEFQKCLDQTESIPYSIVQSIIENELQMKLTGSTTQSTTTRRSQSNFFSAPSTSRQQQSTKYIDQVYSYIDPKPLASASIAQVHRAIVKETNEQVVIKVQKPNIDSYLQVDLSFIYILSRLLEYVQPDLERTSLSTIIGDIRYSMLNELNFTIEAKNTIEFYQFLQKEQLLNIATCPKIYLQYSTSKIITMEYLMGTSLLDEQSIITNNANNANQQEGQTISENVIVNALNIWSLSIRQMPWFHADVHAGNLLLLNDGRIGFIDFGIVGQISTKVLNSVTELSTSLAFNDYIGIAQALCNMGATESTVNIQNFANDIETVLLKINNTPINIDILMEQTTTSTTTATVSSIIDDTDITNILLDLITVTENNGLKLPREFGLLVKQALYFDRYLKILAPNINIMTDERLIIPTSSSTTDTNTNTNKDKTKNSSPVIIDV